MSIHCIISSLVASSRTVITISAFRCLPLRARRGNSEMISATDSRCRASDSSTLPQMYASLHTISLSSPLKIFTHNLACIVVPCQIFGNPCPIWMFPAPCECSPSSVGIPRGACSSFKPGPNSMRLVSIEREKSDLQDYVIRIWNESLLACVYSKWSIF